MELESLRIRPGEADSKLKLRARFDGLGLDDLALPELALQISDDVEDAPLFCARIPSDRLRVSRKVLKFRDRRGDVAEAKGLRTVRIERKRAGILLLAVSGKRAAFLARGSTELRITLAVQDLSQGPAECVSAAEPVRPTNGGGIRFP